MYKLYVTKTTANFTAIVASVIEFDSEEMANLAYSRLKDTMYVSAVKLY